MSITFYKKIHLHCTQEMERVTPSLRPSGLCWCFSGQRSSFQGAFNAMWGCTESCRPKRMLLPWASVSLKDFWEEKFGIFEIFKGLITWICSRLLAFCLGQCQFFSWKPVGHKYFYVRQKYCTFGTLELGGNPQHQHRGAGTVSSISSETWLC